MKIAVGLLILTILVLSGCASEETEEFTENLGPLSNNIGTLMDDISDNFKDYDEKYNSEFLLNAKVITESQFDGMEAISSDLKEKVSELSDFIAEYDSLLENADTEGLTPEQEEAVDKVDTVKAVYGSNQELINSCVISMEKFNILTNLTRRTLALISIWIF